jgi:hypothetical protein
MSLRLDRGLANLVHASIVLLVGLNAFGCATLDYSNVPECEPLAD